MASRAIMIWLVLLSLVPGAHAQIAPSLAPSDPSVQIELMKQRLSELKDPKSSIPDNPGQLEREFVRVDQEIERFSVSSFSPVPENVAPRVADLAAAANKFIADMARLDCGRQLSDFKTIFLEYYTSTGSLLQIVQSAMFRIGEQPDTHIFSLLIGSPTRPTSDQEFQAACYEVKRAISLPSTKPEIDRELNVAAIKLGDASKRAELLKSTSTELVSALRQRRAALQEKINSSSAQRQISDNLPTLLGVIGAASIVIMGMIRFFPADIQIEWVSSGQVIQFVTVMILLSVIMALGLSGILKENTLGTLLGGLAGYILAQGVGRAAARDATRRETSPGANRPRALRRPTWTAGGSGQPARSKRWIAARPRP